MRHGVGIASAARAARRCGSLTRICLHASVNDDLADDAVGEAARQCGKFGVRQEFHPGRDPQTEQVRSTGDGSCKALNSSRLSRNAQLFRQAPWRAREHLRLRMKWRSAEKKRVRPSRATSCARGGEITIQEALSPLNSKPTCMHRKRRGHLSDGHGVDSERKTQKNVEFGLLLAVNRPTCSCISKIASYLFVSRP